MAEQAQSFEDPDDFPDPDAVINDEEEIEIEVLDDTPPEDQRSNRTDMGDREDPDDELEDEITQYGADAQARIKKLKFEFHEERRAKETALRSTEEATRYAQQVGADNAALKQNLDNSHNVLAEQWGARSEAELEKARAEFKEAYDGGETDDLLAAQEKIAQLTAERVNRPAPVQQQQQQQQQVQQPQQQQPVGQPNDARSSQWLQKNNWFHADGSEDMTGYAIGLHQKLVKQGLDPRVHEEYYTKIDEGMRTVFPDRFEEGKSGGNGVDAPVVTSSKKPPKVGGPSRGGKPPRKVQLTTTQVALAKRLGLTNKQYAAQVAKEQLNG